MAREVFALGSDISIEARGTLDRAAQNALDNAEDGSTSTFLVFNPDKYDKLSEAEPSSEVELALVDATKFEVGDTVVVDQEDGTVHTSTVSVVDTPPGTITMDDGLTAQAKKGARVRVVFDSTPIAMTEFGVPKVGSKEYGFRGVLPRGHASQLKDQDVDVEVHFVGAATGGLDEVQKIEAVFQEVVAPSP